MQPAWLLCRPGQREGDQREPFRESQWRPSAHECR